MRILWHFLFLGVFSSLILTGCATKNNGQRAHALTSRTETGLQTAAAEEESGENPILFEEEFEAAERGEVPTYDIPIVRNAKVEQWLNYFQGKGRKWYHTWLERSGRYVPFLRKILKDHGLPEDLVYLAMIESGFSSRAYSRARAVGIWQFMKGTGRMYGLQVDFWVDERRDPEKASVAAARHLKDLYDQFQSWKLAAAAYNAGSGKVSRAIKKYKTEDFWELTKGRYLRPETRHYVPKMIAAALIAKEPEKYGFRDIQFEAPLAYDKVILDNPVNLVALSERAKCDLEELMAINPELNHPVPPPEARQYELRVPEGTSDDFMTALKTIHEDDRANLASHRMRRGDNMARLSKIYSVSANQILKANGLKSASGVRTGQILTIPVELNAHLVSLGKIAARAEEPRGRRRPRRATRREALDSVYKHGPRTAAPKAIQVSKRSESGISKKKSFISSDVGRTSGQSRNDTASPSAKLDKRME